mmetsp:Transcript_19819/g.32271  ORF Transcript_19819/g.32271 Transcript_19819/m.32271 type:complete len:207 (-) Transcript_19819:60-680(-)
MYAIRKSHLNFLVLFLSPVVIATPIPAATSAIVISTTIVSPVIATAASPATVIIPAAAAVVVPAAPAPVATATTATSVAASTTVATSTAATSRLFLGLVHTNGTAIKVGLVGSIQGFVHAGSISKSDKTKTSGTSRVSFSHDTSIDNFPKPFEVLPETVVISVIGKIPNITLIHVAAAATAAAAAAAATTAVITTASSISRHIIID